VNPSGRETKRFSISLSAKFILFAVVMELLLISVGIYAAYTFLSRQQIQRVQIRLSSQVDLLSKELQLEKDRAPNFDFRHLELNPDLLFQVAGIEGPDAGRILWDSRKPERIETRISGPHGLFDLAKSGPNSEKNIQFRIPGAPETFFGSYRKVLDRYVVMGAISSRAIDHDTNFILEKLVYLASLFCGVAFLLIVFFSNRIIRPIRKLTFAAEQIASGNFDLALKESGSTSNDEIGVLSRAFSIMAQRVRALLQDELQKVRMKQEVSNVAHIQQSLLPKPSIQASRYEIQSYYQSAAETGGDYWGYFEVKNHLVVYIADATGHGLTSAMLTVAARGCFSALHRLLVNRPELTPIPSKFLAYANDAVLESAQEELNMTMFVAVYSYEDGTLTYANAGHNPGWIVRNENGQRKIEVLKGSGVRLGESQHYVAPEDKQVRLNEGDAIFLYTDGILDCQNESQEQYGKARVKALLTELMQKHGNQSLETVRNGLVDDFTAFIGDRPLADDITFALIHPFSKPSSGAAS